MKRQNYQISEAIRKTLVHEGYSIPVAQAVSRVVAAGRAGVAGRDLGNRVVTAEAFSEVETATESTALREWRRSASRYERRELVKFLVRHATPAPLAAVVTGCRLAMIRHHARRMRVHLPVWHWGRHGRPG